MNPFDVLRQVADAGREKLTCSSEDPQTLSDLMSELSDHYYSISYLTLLIHAARELKWSEFRFAAAVQRMLGANLSMSNADLREMEFTLKERRPEQLAENTSEQIVFET